MRRDSAAKGMENQRDGVSPESRHFVPGSKSPGLGLLDIRNMGFFSFWVIALNGLGLGVLEYFRHTEADRTLIGWEMAETGDFLVPHLLHSVILTKPPMFYWLVAASISFWGSAAEWAARFPTLCVSLLFVLSHYFFLRLIRCSMLWSLGSTLFLSTSILFMVKATAAEIDLLFSFFCTVCLYAAFLATVRRSALWTFSVYVLAALAFLTKGPPVLFFLGVSHLLFFSFFRRSMIRHGDAAKAPQSWTNFALINAGGILIFLLIVLAWLIPLANEVGWESLGTQVRVEILERVLQSSRPGRGIWFYPVCLLTSVAPWSIFFVLGLVIFALSGRRREAFRQTLSSPYREFLVFNLIVVISAIVMLSFSAGKSSRYLLPVHAFGINLCAFAAFAVRRTQVEKWLLDFGKFIAPGAAVVSLMVPFFLDFEGVSRGNMLSAAVVLSVSLLVLGMSCWERRSGVALAAIALVMFAVRFGQFQIYSPHRNATRSVKPVAEAINRLMPAGSPLYTIEMFERWVNYYLKRIGRESIRLTPESIQVSRPPDARMHLLLNFEEEYWRVLQLGLYDETAGVIGVFRVNRDHLVLLEADRGKLHLLKPKVMFPTKPSEPFSSEVPQLAKLTALGERTPDF